MAVRADRPASRAPRPSGRSCRPSRPSSRCSSHVSPSQRSRIRASAATVRSSPVSKPGAEVRADVEDDRVRFDRGRDVERGAQRRDRLLVDLVVGRREIAEVEGVADHAADARFLATLAGSCATASGLWSVGRHMRGLCVKTWTQSPPIASMRSMAVWIPPAEETCAPNSTRPYDRDVSDVRVRMAPSPTGFLHIGGVRTFLFNWLFARKHGGEILLRIENTDTSREVAEAVDQIKESLIWLGIDWDGDVRFQLDTADKARELAERLVSEDKAYVDEGAIRFRQPKEGTVSWDDAVRGRIEFRNELLPDTVIVRSDGRPTYNFVSPVDDVFDEITHVIRGEDHVSNTPTQINILRALGADLPVVRAPAEHQRRRRPQALEAAQRRRARRLPRGRLPAGRALQLPRAARVELRRQDDDHVASRARRAFRSRPGRAEPRDVRLQEARLAERRLPAQPPARRVRPLALQVARRAGHRLAARSRARDGATRRGEDRDVRAVPGLRPLSVRGRQPGRRRPARSAAPPTSGWSTSSRGRPPRLEEELRALADELGEKPRTAFQPIRLAITGSKISPGLFESMELLGKEKSLARLAAAYGR